MPDAVFVPPVLTCAGPEGLAGPRVLRGRSARLRGFVLSVALHATVVGVAVLGLSSLPPVPRPDSTLAAIDVVMETEKPEPETVPTPSPPVAPPAPSTEPAAAAPSPPVLAPSLPASPRWEILPRPLHQPPMLARAPVRELPPSSPTAGPPGPVVPPTMVSTPPAAVSQVAAPPSARPSPAWLAGVNDWLLAHLSYPEMARRLGRQGTVLVRFIADRDGRVLEVTLVRGSGSAALDEAAQTLLHNARLPPFPPDMALPQQSVTVPIRYRLD